MQRASGGRDPGRFSIFANFQFRPTCLWRAKGHLEQHARSASHRAACKAYYHRKPAAPDAKASDLSPGATGAGPLHQPLVVMPRTAPVDSDTELLKGNVPSISEWFEGWCALSEPTVSIAGIARSEQKRSNGDKNLGRLRARVRKQALAMAEVCRQENRENLRRATQITVAMDESKYRKDHTFPLRSAEQPHRREPLAPPHRMLWWPRPGGDNRRV